MSSFSGLLALLASEASMEVANITERKNSHTPVYGVKEFVCQSVVIYKRLFVLSSNAKGAFINDVTVIWTIFDPLNPSVTL